MDVGSPELRSIKNILMTLSFYCMSLDNSTLDFFSKKQTSQSYSIILKTAVLFTQNVFVTYVSVKYPIEIRKRKQNTFSSAPQPLAFVLACYTVTDGSLVPITCQTFLEIPAL